MNIAESSQRILQDLGVETWFAVETTSTNTIAKNEAGEIHVPLKVYLTNHQTAGRGRNQNTWNDRGHSLLSSWSFSFLKSPQPILAALVGLAVYENLTKCFSGPAFSLKAPNDILVGNEKLCGILIENVVSGSNGRSIIGIGLNVSDSPDSLGATHLTQHSAFNEQSWRKFLAGLAKDLEACIISAGRPEMSTETCQELLKALRKNPLLKDELREVTPLGSLIFQNKKIDWQDL